MADIKISQLGAALAINDTDVVPIVSGGNTLKATAAQLKEHAIGDTDISDLGNGTPTGAIAALNTELGTTKQALTTKVNTSDIANNLTTTTEGKVLDARQGKTLNDKIPYFPNSGWTTLSNGVKYKKSGGLVYLIGTFGTSVTVTSGSLSIGTLPSGCRPYVKTWIPCGAELDPAILEIDTDGTVVLKTNRTTAFYLGLCATFPVQL